MTDRLRALVVEDSESDAKLLARELRRRYPALHVHRVDDAAGLREALETGEWDIVISDWSVPGLGGTAALRMTREMGLDLPFIIVSGTIGEDAAVEAMRQGAHDYVLKDRLSRLLPAVEREVREGRLRAELRQERERAAEGLRRAHAELEGCVAQRTDELRIANEALVHARDAAEAASRAKSAFLANMSHEIRTPMNAVLGYTQLLLRSPRLAPEERGYLEVILRSGDHLLELINDVLEMSKLEAGHHRLHRGTVDIQALIEDLERMFRLRADAKRLSFEVNRAPDVPRFIAGDEGKLRQVLINLLGNAVKFTEAGGVVARLLVKGAEADERRLSVEIEDTGPGISPGELAGLFQPFAQARVGIEVRGGTGLGLALSRELARLMDGDVTVRSTAGRGSVFLLEIPIEVVGAPPPRSLEASARSPAAQPTADVRLGAGPSLPPELARGLRDAARIADYERLQELVEAIPPGQEAVANELRQLVDRYAYDEIERRVLPSS